MMRPTHDMDCAQGASDIWLRSPSAPRAASADARAAVPTRTAGRPALSRSTRTWIGVTLASVLLAAACSDERAPAPSDPTSEATPSPADRAPRSPLEQTALAPETGVLPSPAPSPSQSGQAGPQRRSQPIDDFMRIRRDETGAMISLDTSITRFRKPLDAGAWVHVDLIGAVHMGESTYYDALNEAFTGYDALLYELIAPEGLELTREMLTDRNDNLLSNVQTTMGDQLELEFQLEHIDYTAANFVHADMSPSELAASFAEGGSDVTGIAMRAFAYSLSSQRPSRDLSFAIALLSNNRAMRLRRTMASELIEMQDALDVIEGPDGSTLIRHRNSKAFGVLARELRQGHRDLGLFYGVGHLPDMQARLVEELGFEPVSRRWIVAWRLTKDEVPPDDAVIEFARDLPPEAAG